MPAGGEKTSSLSAAARKPCILRGLPALALLGGLAFALAVPQAMAQASRPAAGATQKDSKQDGGKDGQEKKPAVPEAAPPPYEPQLLRLAEIMGALSYLRDLCGDGDGNEWRRRMQALIEAEARNQRQKAVMAGAFNKGFRGFELTYRTCTPHARAVIIRYLAEGRRIARDVASRYGGG